MIDIHAGPAISRTSGLPSSSSEPESDGPQAKQKAYGTLSPAIFSSTTANVRIAGCDQRAFPTLKQPLSRTWLLASLFSLLVLLSIALWYMAVGRVMYTNDLYFDVGQVSHPTDVSAIAGYQHRTLRQILSRPHTRLVQITYRQGKDARGGADVDSFDQDCASR
jgi:hypothetical protein